MADAPASVRNVSVSHRPGQGPGCVERVFLNAEFGTIIALQDAELVFPTGCRELEIQPRLCGDYYAAIRGDKFYVSGFGPAPLDAVNGALAKVPA